MNSHKQPTDWLAWVLILGTVFSFAGWYTAESDNEILRKQALHQTHSEVCHAD